MRPPSPAEPKRGSVPIAARGGSFPDIQASFKKVSPCQKANDRKAKLPKFEQSDVFKFFKLSSLNDHALYGKPVREGTGSWLVAPLLCFEFAQQFKCAATRVAPLLCFEFAQQLKRAADSYDKVSCRQRHCQQAADVPHSALAARVPAPASSLKA
ncbi:hypothetical protein ACQJBY_037022 [Aegilops geniculata]